MKGLMVAILVLLLTSCSMKFQQPITKPSEEWKGQSIEALFKKWGDADQVIYAGSGFAYYGYTTQANAKWINATTSRFSTFAGSDSAALASISGINGFGKCITLFKVDGDGIIVETWHQGSHCIGEPN